MPLDFRNDQTTLRSLVLIVVLLVVSLGSVSIYASEGENGVLHGVQGVVSAAATPFKIVSGSISSIEDGVSRGVSDLSADADTLSALKEQNSQLRDAVSQLEEYRQEAQRLQGLLNYKNSYEAQGVVARTLSRSDDAWNRVVTIDKGSNEGVRAGLPVLGSSGVVGQVISCTALTSEVRLLADPNSGVSVKIQSSRAEGILRGSLDGLLYLEDVDADDEVKTGDVVMTSGLGGGYFRGMTVGTVVKVDGETGSTDRTIIVEPNDSARPLEEVMVVLSMNEDAADAANTSTDESSDETEGTSSSSSSSSASEEEEATQDQYSYSSDANASASGSYSDDSAYGYDQSSASSSSAAYGSSTGASQGSGSSSGTGTGGN